MSNKSFEKLPSGSKLLMLFADNASNIYSIYTNDESNFLIYDPMRPMNSCNGKYSGGQSFIKELSQEEFNELDEAFKELASKYELHICERTRCSGLFTSKNDKFIVALGDYQRFEEIVKQHRVEITNKTQIMEC